MDALKRELERKKKALKEVKKKSGGKRFMKASERRRLQETSSEEEHEAVVEKRDLSEEEEPQLEKPLKKKQKNDNNSQSEAALTESTNSLLPSSTVSQTQLQLRALRLPITLFGECPQDRLKRLGEALKQQSESQLHQKEADEFRLGQGHGIRNPFLEKKADIDDDLEHNNASDLAPSKPASVADIAKETKRKKEEKEKEEHQDTDDPYKKVYRHFKGLLRHWEAALNDRSDSVKRSLAGRNETKTLKQCKDYIRPLFQLLKRRQLEENLLHKLEQMVQYCQQGEFVRANDQYLDVAIGRAAWPIGVTMVGIHARTGRAKIESSNVAHVMNSELQRKYLTSVKRLLTYEQTIRTDVDPSKKVVN